MEPPRSKILPHLSSYYDMTSFFGRLKYNWSICNPLALRWGEASVRQASSTVDKHMSGVEIPTADLKHAQTVLSVAAPQGILIPIPCRTAGWGLSTVPIMAFIVRNATLHPTSLPRIIVGQWLNQTQNAVVTWYNRPRTSSSQDVRNADEVWAVSAYLGACAVAIPVAVASGLAAQRSSMLKPFGRFAPFPGVVLANVLNTCVMRSADLSSGIPLRDSQGRELGRSRVAGRRAVAETCIPRTMIPLANFVAVPLVMAAIGRLRPGRPQSLILQLSVTATALITAIPLASATSAPVGSITAELIEEEIAVVAREKDVHTLHYERGF